MARGKLWNEREDRVIAGAAGAGLSAAACAVKLRGRDAAAVRKRASALKIRFGGPRIERKPVGGAAVKARRDEARRVLGLPDPADAAAPRSRSRAQRAAPDDPAPLLRVSDLLERGRELGPDERKRLLSGLIVADGLPAVDRVRLLGELRSLEKQTGPVAVKPDAHRVSKARSDAAAALLLARLRFQLFVDGRCRHCEKPAPLDPADLVSRVLGDRGVADETRRIGGVVWLLRSALSVLGPIADEAERAAVEKGGPPPPRNPADAPDAIRRELAGSFRTAAPASASGGAP